MDSALARIKASTHKRCDWADMPLVKQDGRAPSDGSRGCNPETREAP